MALTNNWRLLSFGFLLQFFSIAGQSAYISLFGGYIRADLNLSHSEFGGYYSLATFGSALLLSYTGQLTDRIRLDRLTPCVTLLFALSCMMMALTESIGMLIAVFFLLRHLGQGLFTLIGVTAIMRYIEKNRGSVSSIARMGYSAAEGMMPMIVVILLSFFSWRGVWFVMGCLILIVIPVTYFLLYNHAHRHQHYLNSLNEAGQTDKESFSLGSHEMPIRQYTRYQVLTDPIFYIILPTLLATPMLFTGFIFHQIQFLVEKNWTLSWWSGVLFTYSLTGVGFLMISGLLVDKFTAKRVLFLIPTILGVGFVLMAYASSTEMALIAMMLMSFAASFSSCLSAPLLVELYGTRHLGSIKSFSSSLIILSTAVSPFVMGFFLDKGFSFASLLLSSGVYCLLALLLLSFLLLRGHRQEPTTI